MVAQPFLPFIFFKNVNLFVYIFINIQVYINILSSLICDSLFPIPNSAFIAKARNVFLGSEINIQKQDKRKIVPY